MENKEASRWYSSAADWYRPLNEKELIPAADEKRRKKRNKNKILKRTMLVVFILLVITAVALILIPSPAQTPSSSAAAPEPVNTKSPETEGSSSNVYNTEGGTTSIARYISDEAYNLSLISTAGKQKLALGDIYDSCIDSIVVITAGSEGSAWKSWGTGIIMSGDGYIVTNDHIIEGTDWAKVELWSGETYDALLVGEDYDTDLAVLKIDALNLPAAEFGLSSELRVGDEVCAIGNPLSRQLTGTMTNGIISAVNRDIYVGNGLTMNLIQTNTALNEGNSGGPLINSYGQVVGITNMKLMTSATLNNIEGIGFAIPSATIEIITEKIISGSESSGKPGIGIVGYALSNAQCGRFGVKGGVYISSVTAGTDAWGKLKTGDVIIAVNGSAVASVDDINELKADLGIGDTLEVAIKRDSEELTVTITLVDMSLVG